MSSPVNLPEKFELHINNWQFPSYFIGLEGDALIYANTRLGPIPGTLPEVYKWYSVLSIIHKKPEECQWQSFWKKMDALHMWEWEENYDCNTYNPTPVLWRLEIGLLDKKLLSRGSDGFPGDDDNYFWYFLLALEELIEGVNLQWWRQRCDRIPSWNNVPHNGQEKADFKPTAFEVNIGGFFGPSAVVKWKNGNLAGQRAKSGLPLSDSKIFSPSALSWSQFWNTIDDLGCWEWNGTYDNFDILDGTSWSIVIAHNNHVLIANGSNAYPGSEGPEYSKIFIQFITALNDLIGVNKYFE